MKKKTRLLSCILSVLICATAFSGLAGCGKEQLEGAIYDDPNIPNIYYYYYDGDGEKTWLFDAAVEFNKTISDYEIMPYGTLNEEYSLNLVANGGDASILTMTHPDINSLINAKDIVDLSSILQKDVDGKGVKLQDKFQNLTEIKAQYSNVNNKGMYGVPLSYSPQHLIYDHDLFVANGWLIYQKDGNGTPVRDGSGKIVLSVGRDGVAGTYDDGQPVNIQEWEEMMGRISNANNTKGFIYTTKYPFYIEPLVTSLIAQYGGLEECIDIFSGYGSYTNASGNEVQVAIENGYEMYNAPSILKAMEFMKKYLVSEQYVHERCWDTTGLSHSEAMKVFVTGFQEEVQQAAFLVEGSGFELSVKEYLNQIESLGNDGYGYGDREFRFMLLPQLGNDTKAYLHAQSLSTVVVSADTNQRRVEIAKDFVAYTLQDKYLQQYTLNTGDVRPLEYTLTSGQQAQLTPFQRSSIAMQQDTENVKVISVLDYAEKEPEKNGLITFKGAGYQYSGSFSEGNIERVLTALMRKTPAEYVQGIYKYRKNVVWGVAN